MVCSDSDLCIMTSDTGDLLVNEIAPRLTTLLPHSVTPIGTEDIEELRQDALALAAKLLTRAVETGKAVTAGNIAYYTVQLMKSGRRSTGSRATDVLGTMTGMRGRAQVTSTEQPVTADGGEPMTFGELLADEGEDPATEALRHLAWEELGEKLSTREKAVASALAEGRGLREAGRELSLCPSAMSAARNSLAGRIAEEWGDDAVQEAGREPEWKPTLYAYRQRRAPRVVEG